MSLIGITLGTLYQNVTAAGAPEISCNISARCVFAFGAFAFEAREIH
jgi:hypothetical protein